MMSLESRQNLDAFREKVFNTFILQNDLHRPMAHDAWAAYVVKLGAEAGFVFEETDVRDIMREGQMTWLTHWTPAP